MRSEAIASRVTTPNRVSSCCAVAAKREVELPQSWVMLLTSDHLPEASNGMELRWDPTLPLFLRSRLDDVSSARKGASVSFVTSPAQTRSQRARKTLVL